MPDTKYTASISGFCRGTTVFSALKELKQAGFDGVDFPLSIYSRKPTDPLQNDRWWREWTQAVAAYTADLQLPVVQAHAPWHQTIPTDFHFVPPDEIYARIFEAGVILRCSVLVFHPVPYPHRIPSAQMLAAIHQYNIQWFRCLLPLAEKYRIRIALENTFDYYHLQMPGDPVLPYTTAEGLCALAEEIASPLVGFCLDTGHANIAGQKLPGMIQTFGDRLLCLHLNDNYGKRSGASEDLHLFPTEGTIDWSGVAEELRRSGYRGTVNLEPIGALPEVSPGKRFALLQQGRGQIAQIF